jgi:hypothetical protein
VTRGCSDRSLEAQEPLAGSAGHVAAWFGIAWPKPRWHPADASHSQGLPSELRALEIEEERAGRAFALRLFQREPRPPTAAVELLAVDPKRRRSARLLEVPVAALARELRRFLAGEPIGPPIAAPTLLVCTDGRHDRCCAVRGRPVFDAVHAEVAQRGLDIEVAQASHLGGHRFASTVLALPEGRLYGRLEASEAARLVDAAATGSVVAEHDRGSLALPEIDQVAEAAARSRIPDAETIEIAGASEAPGGLGVRVAVRRNGSLERFSVFCRRHSFESPASCGESPAARERWVAETIVPL